MRSIVMAMMLACCTLAHAEKSKPPGKAKPAPSKRASTDAFASYVASVERGAPDAASLAGCHVLVTPSGVVRHPCMLLLPDLVGARTGVTLRVTRNERHPFPQSTMAYRDAIVEARADSGVIATFHVLEISEATAEHPIAVHWSELRADKEVTALARLHALLPPPMIRDAVEASKQSGQGKEDDEALFADVGRVKGSAKYQQDLAAVTSDGVVVFGSGPGERYTGKPGQKTISRWKIDLDQEGGVDVTGGNMIGVAVTHFIATSHDKVPVTVPYVGFVVYTQYMTGGGSVASRPAIVKLAVAR